MRGTRELGRRAAKGMGVRASSARSHVPGGARRARHGHGGRSSRSWCRRRGRRHVHGAAARPDGGSFAPGEMLVNAAFGLGIPVVEGARRPTSSASIGRPVRCASTWSRTSVARSSSAKTGSSEIEVDARQGAAPALAASALARLAELARKLESARAEGAVRRRVRRRERASVDRAGAPGAGGVSRGRQAQRRSGRARTSARRCPARRRRSPGRSRAPSPSAAFARRSPRSDARFRAASASWPTCTAAST